MAIIRLFGDSVLSVADMLALELTVFKPNAFGRVIATVPSLIMTAGGKNQ
jgi:hypothetical protein